MVENELLRLPWDRDPLLPLLQGRSLICLGFLHAFLEDMVSPFVRYAFPAPKTLRLE